MADTLYMDNLPFGVLVTLVVASAGFGTLGYAIALRRTRHSFVIFLALFAVTFLFMTFLEATILAIWPSVHGTICGAAARLSGGILATAGVHNTVTASSIALLNPVLVFRVDAACLGGMLFWAYIALVFAETKASVRQRAAGMLAGIVILLVFNFLRITWSIYLEWRTGVGVHDYFYLVNMVVVLLVWAGWLRTLKFGPPGPAVSTPPRESAAPAGQ